MQKSRRGQKKSKPPVKGETVDGLRAELFATLMIAAELLEDAGRYREAESAYRRVLTIRPDDGMACFRLARALINQDKAEEALNLLRALSEKEPDNRDVASWYAGLLSTDGDPSSGAAVMRDHYRDHPIAIRPGRDKALPPILLIRGFSNTRVLLGRDAPDGKLRPGYRGGNFSHTHLLIDPAFAVIDYTIASENILSEVGSEAPRLPDKALIVNSIADADIEAESLKTLDAFIRETGMPVINPPQQVLKTTRDSNYQRLRETDGFYVPRTIRLSLGDDGADGLISGLKAEGFTPPFILREAGTHTARATTLVQDWGAVPAFLDGLADTHSGGLGDVFYATEFVDCRGAEDTRAAGTYNKKRFFFIDRRLYPVVSHIDRVWNVHGSNRREVMRRTPWMIEQEKRFLADPRAEIGAPAYDRIEALKDDVGLDFFGIDFTMMPDGRVLVFEMNPAMRHSHDHARNTPHLTPYMEAITKAFEAMVRERLLALAASGSTE